jgi:hypothetical protein
MSEIKSDSRKRNHFFGKTHSDETKRKMREASKRRWEKSESHKKMSEIQKKRFENPEECKKNGRRGSKHPNFGKHLSEETRKKISEKQKGKTISQEHRDKLSKSQLGKKSPHSEETKRKISKSHFGIKPSEETRKKLSESHKGKKHSEEQNRKMSERFGGTKNPRFGKHLSEETRNKLITSHIVGGIWYGNVRYGNNPYCEKFNNDLRERVRAFWGYQCFNCGTPQNGTKLHIHHIHYNKKTCCDGSPHDMIPLCNTCHGKTNHNRDYWEDHFTELLYAWNPDGKCFFTKEEMVTFIGDKP